MCEGSLPTIEVPLTFIVPSWPGKPRVLMSINHAEPNRPTGEFRSVVVPIADARSLPERPTLDREGFALQEHRTRVADFYDATAVERVYYAEIVELLKRATGAAEVHVFDHTLRVEDEAKRRAHAPAEEPSTASFSDSRSARRNCAAVDHAGGT
jgi:hypothetical protein